MSGSPLSRFALARIPPCGELPRASSLRFPPVVLQDRQAGYAATGNPPTPRASAGGWFIGHHARKLGIIEKGIPIVEDWQ
jgi:hypothetical protein